MKTTRFGTRLSVSLTEKQRNRLAFLAGKHQMSITQVIREMIVTGLDEWEDVGDWELPFKFTMLPRNANTRILGESHFRGEGFDKDIFKAILLSDYLGTLSPHYVVDQVEFPEKGCTRYVWLFWRASMPR